VAVDQAVGAEAADPVEALARAEIALGDGHHLAGGAGERTCRLQARCHQKWEVVLQLFDSKSKKYRG
jgi:hypothetical protein